MLFFRASFFAVLLYALQVGASALSPVGWVPAVLACCAVIAVWLGRDAWVGFALAPAALLFDLLHAQPVPLTLASVLACWGIVALLQRGWLTNHSSASLVALTIAGLAVAHGTQLTVQSIGHASGVLDADIRDAWASWQSVRLFALESVVTIFLGIASRAILRSVSRRFIYATR